MLAKSIPFINFVKYLPMIFTTPNVRDLAFHSRSRGNAPSRKGLKAFYEKEGERSALSCVSSDPVIAPYLDIAKIGQSQLVLDVGCGDGYLLNKIKERSAAFGIELSSTRARRAKKKGIEIIVADAEALPLVECCFDTCFCVEVLEHIPKPARVIQELARVLKPSGALIIVVPNDRNWFVCRLLGGNLVEAFHCWGHLHDFSRLETIQTMSNGFRILEVKENKHKPLILMSGLYQGFTRAKKALSKIVGTSKAVQNERAGDKSQSSTISKFLEIYLKYMPIPRLTLHTIIKLVKNGPITGNSICRPDFQRARRQIRLQRMSVETADSS